ncbi:MAG: trigger factor [Desulfurella sp.]|jgi:trigger factor|uniref:Trigger factor n=1 Tax=Desulfurella multipotens TaxID=79269 RepID=A0A1G6R244_9BACT|nr:MULTISPECIES: trigger factor [Desulfurella]PMP63549.1 MAG: trigger factor [Desulfurella multipotens]PMP93640.1 MAG: trigger factor [Desulfurella sp.]SDC98730.1 trigger factor [Desulfurella multipotens]HEX13782.1 trigger factor [Desulfurella acetivorans]
MFEVKVEKVQPSKRKMFIKVPIQKVQKTKEDIINHLKKTVNIKGFRKGKVPKEIILKNYGKDIDEDVKRDLLEEGYRFCVSENNLSVVSDPIFLNVKDFNEEGFYFEVEVEVKPDIELKEYKGIKVSQKPYEVSQEDIDKSIKQLKSAFSSLEDSHEEAKLNDVVVFDIKAKDVQTGEEIKDLTGKDLYVQLGTNQLISEVENAIVGMKENDEKTITVTFPQEHSIKSIAGKQVELTITLKNIKKVIEPELNDEFAQKINKDFKTVNDLIEDIKKRLAENKRLQEIERQKEEILEKLLDSHDFELPQTVVSKETSNLIMDFVKNAYYRGIDLKQEEYKPAKLRERFEPEAVKRVKATFLLLEIADKENIDVSGEEVRNAIEKEANISGKSFEQLYKEYEEKGMLPLIKVDLLSDKVLDFLLENAVKEEAV